MSVADTQAFYGRWARLYDLLATAPGVTGWRRRAVDALDLSPGDTVVEMGCGTGANFPYLRDRVGPEGVVLGIDVTPGVLKTARRRVRKHGWDNVHLCRADATRPPVAGEVDAILGAFVVGMFESPGEVVADWCTLCPGGRAALLNFQRNDRAPGAPLNAALDALLWVASPAWTLPDDRPSAGFQRRIRAARTALTDRTVERRYESFGCGFLGLLSGRVPTSDPGGLTVTGDIRESPVR